MDDIVKITVPGFCTKLLEQCLYRLSRIQHNLSLKDKDVLDTEEVSIFTGLSKSTIYKATCENKIPHYKLNGKRCYFVKKEIEQWMKQNPVPVKSNN